jgi:hypothetical protein
LLEESEAVWANSRSSGENITTHAFINSDRLFGYLLNGGQNPPVLKGSHVG